MSKRPEYLVSVLALWRLGAVLVPMFIAFSTGAIRLRTEGRESRLVITEAAYADAVRSIDDVDLVLVEEDHVALLHHDPLESAVAVGRQSVLVTQAVTNFAGCSDDVPGDGEESDSAAIVYAVHPLQASR